MKRPDRIRILGGGRRVLTEAGRPLGSRAGDGLSVHRMAGTGPGLKTILLVEDDQQLRDFMLLVLRGAGYVVAAADSAAQAHEAWDRCRGQIDLLVTDMMIPTCSTGLELARQFRREKRGLPVIVTSGFGPEIAGDQTAELQTLAYLRKPFSADELLRTVAASFRAAVR